MMRITPYRAHTLDESRQAGSLLEGYVDFEDVDDLPDDPVEGVIRLYARDRRGHITMVAQNGAGVELDALVDTVTKLRNTTGSVIPRGTVVYTAGSQGNNPIVGLAQADSEDTMPATGVSAHDVPNNAWGLFYVTALVEDIDTSDWPEGTKLFVSPDTAGELTATEPTHPNLAQVVGVVENQHANQGSIAVNIPPFLSGRESGTNRDNFTVGSGAESELRLYDASGQLWRLTIDTNGDVQTSTVT